MKRFLMVHLLLVGCLCLLMAGQVAAKPVATEDNVAKQDKATAEEEAEKALRPIRVALFPIGATSNVEVDPDALTDQVHTLASMLPEVTLVDRAELTKTAEEHKMALSGLIQDDSAVKLGKMLNAQYILVGRASKIGQTHYVVLRLIDVETTQQTTISAKAPVSKGIEAVLESLDDSLSKKVQEVQTTPLDAESQANLEKLKKLKKLLAPMKGKRFLVSVPEEHVNRRIEDPAAQMAITHFLSQFDIQFIVPKDPPTDWKDHLLETGKYDDQKVDYLLEGEGVSEFAGQVQGLMSCRARVELRLVKLPGRSVLAIDKGVAAGVDLTESLGSKSALEKAGTLAAESVLSRAMEKLGEKKPERKP